MPVGLEVYSAGGIPTFSVTDRLPRLVGVVSIPSKTNGSATVPELALGTPLVAFFSYGDGDFFVGDPDVSFSGTTVSWAYSTPGDPANNTGAIYCFIG